MVVTNAGARFPPWRTGSGDFGRALAIKCTAGRYGDFFRHLNLHGVDVNVWLASGISRTGFQQLREVYAMSVVRNCLSGLISPAVLAAAISITTTGAMAAPCT